MGIKEIDTKDLILLHQGRHSSVYRFDNAPDGIQVVVKIARTAAPFSRTAELFANELKITQQFDHPGIRTAIESGTLSGKASLLLRYVPGVSLKDFCAAEHPGLAEKISIGRDVAETLVVLHNSNIIHKNLSSDHILIGPGRSPVLIGFTLAEHCTLSQMLDRPELLEGDLAYIAPEQTGRINRGIDFRTDLYSLGVVFYEMLTGELPFTAETAAELIYAHLARPPRAVATVNPEVPTMVSDIVMKLLSKSADERYQSAFGVARDLERCLSLLEQTGQIAAFPLGRDDVSAGLLVPQGLYGREAEAISLENSFLRAVQGQTEVVLVSGPEGSGKTLLVNELKRPVLERGCLFVAGSHDQYQRNVPYNGLNQVFSALSSMLSGREPQQLQALRAKLSSQVGHCQHLLNSMCPGLHMLMPDEGVEHAGMASLHSSSAPLHAPISSIISLLAQEFGPLVVFLDDLHWADSGTLEVFRLLAEEKAKVPLLLIGAYDGSSSAAGNSFGKRGGATVEDLPLQRIGLENLDLQSLGHLIEDIVQRSDGQAEAFAEIVFNKTGGNPLLAITFIQSLYTEGGLWFDFAQRQWCWHEDLVQKKAVMEDVIGSVTEKVQKLSPGCRELIKTAACIGREFSLETLQAMLGGHTDSLHRLLLEAGEALLIVPLRNMDEQAEQTVDKNPVFGPTRFVFSHDRVRSAVVSLLSPRMKRQTHLQVGRLFLAQLSSEELDKHIFTVVDQLNEGFRYIKTEEELVQLAALNCMAGTHALRSGGYVGAVWYFNMGLGLLPQDKWERYAELTCDLFDKAIEAEYASRNFSRTLVLAEELASHARGRDERAKAYKYQIIACAAQGNRDQTLDKALKTLEVLGVLSLDELPSLSPSPLTGPDQVDMAAIIKASRMLSQEIHLDRLLEKFMQIVMNNAGAEKGVLIIDRDGQLFVQARGTTDGPGIEISDAIPIEEDNDIPQSVVNVVVQLKKAVVLGDARSDPEYGQDKYVQDRQARSILGLPLVHQKKLVGVLYLENNLATDVFALDRLQLLDALLSQAAIFIENAKLYQRLEEKFEELRVTQEALVESRNWLDQILNTIPEPIFVKDRQHRWELLNDAFCTFVERPREELLGKSDYDFFPKEEADVFWAKDEQVFATGEENVNEEKLSDMHGVSRTIITRKLLYVDEKGGEHIVAIIRDITDRVNLEAQLRQAAKMEAVGNLAGGVAHDFNNLLTAIIGYCDLLKIRVGNDTRLLGNIEQIKKAGQSAASLTQQLLAFSRKQLLQPQVLDLNRVVTGTEKMLRRLIGENIQVESVLQEGLGRVLADPVLIEQIIINLCVNARDAMPQGGKLILETANVELDDAYARQYLEVEPGPHVLLSVSDTGVGLDSETLSHIFEPFFTTKEKGKGTGLGLATVYGIVKQSRGHIAVYSEPGNGSCFKIYLPRSQESDETAESGTEQQSGLQGRKETILLAEDDAMVRELADSILREFGYEVLTAANGLEALQLLKDCTEVPDLLITDVIMPEMGGQELAEQVKLRWPNMRIIFVSGYTGGAIHHNGVLSGDVEFLQKPFTAQAIAQKVRDVLDAR
nr:AAA family ATPase [uncultured Desulfobulbus sp.]